MRKKYFVPLLIVGALLILSILPIINYNVDVWRVLHNDYDHYYKGRTPNHSYLKVKYLLDANQTYDTLVMGSSRGGYMDMKYIPGSVYNMKFIFGTMGVHLNNLKVLLKHNVKFKHLWIGINDYIIWKNPDSHDNSFKRRPYKEGFFAALSTSLFYLFEKIGTEQKKVLKGKTYLIASKVNTDPNENNMPFAYRREKNILKNPALNIKKMTASKPTLLGYTDQTYRIDKAIEEIKEIKRLCDANDITLTLFMYPSFYRTYLQYNQYKIEEFKRKLVNVSDFHDFYYMRDLSLNELLWHDSSHFTVSVGNKMIQDIQQNNFLVTKETIDAQIIKTRESIIKILKKPLNYIYKFNANMDLTSLTKIFDIMDNSHAYTINDHMTLKKENQFIKMYVKGNDPVLILNSFTPKSKNAILSYKIKSKKKTVMTLFYKKSVNANYNEGEAYRIPIKKGINTFNILIPNQYLGNGLRIDPAEEKGIYLIEKFAVYALDENSK